MLTSLITNHYIFVAILALALTLLFLELVVPSFGILGISGIYLTFESILAMKNFQNSLGLVLTSLIFALAISLFIIHIFIRNFKNNKLVLNSKIAYKGNSNKLSEDLVDKEGIVLKVLRPSGEIEIDGKVYNAISNGNYIDKGEKVLVKSVEGSQLLVNKLN